MASPVGQILMGPVKTNLASHTFTWGVQLVFVDKNFHEDKVKIHTSILKSFKLLSAGTEVELLQLGQEQRSDFPVNNHFYLRAAAEFSKIHFQPLPFLLSGET